MSERTVRDRMATLLAQRRVYREEGSGRGRKPLVYVVTSTAQAAPRLVT